MITRSISVSPPHTHTHNKIHAKKYNFTISAPSLPITCSSLEQLDSLPKDHDSIKKVLHNGVSFWYYALETRIVRTIDASSKMFLKFTIGSLLMHSNGHIHLLKLGPFWSFKEHQSRCVIYIIINSLKYAPTKFLKRSSIFYHYWTAAWDVQSQVAL